MRRVKEKTLTRMEALSRAYSLSRPLLGGDAKSSLRVVLESLNEWDVDWLAQKHRTYHKKAVPHRTPNKIILSRPALLQYIVCRQTTAYEIAQEEDFLKGRGRLTERTMLLRYVKHLLHESTSRSFYVAVGVCRVLHKYDHAMTRRFYAVLDQRDQKRLADGEPDNRTDDEYRRWKMILVDKLEHRFKEFVSVTRGCRNEKRFLPNDQSGAWSEYIRQCLGLLTPWETEHILPPEFEPTEFNIAELNCQGRRDEWDSAEERRMHTMIDPECFSRLVKACGAPAPEQQLDVPQFKSVEQGPDGGEGDQGGGESELTFAQAKSILDELDNRSTRRRVAVSEYLSVEVDGVERGRFDTAGGSGLQLDLSAESRQIQVFTTDAEGKLLLASLWLSLIDIAPDAGWESSIVLEGGQRLGIEIKPVLNPAGELESLTARISYHESDPLRILSHYLQRIRGVVSDQLDTALDHARSWPRAVYAHRNVFAGVTLLAVFAATLIPTLRDSYDPAADMHAVTTNNTASSPPAPTPTISQHASLAGSAWPGAENRDHRPSGTPQPFNQERVRSFSLSPDSSVLATANAVRFPGAEAKLWHLNRELKSYTLPTVSVPLTAQPLSADHTLAIQLSRGWLQASEVESGRDRPLFPAIKDLALVTTQDSFVGGASAQPSTGLNALATLFGLPANERTAIYSRRGNQISVLSRFTTTELPVAGLRPADTDIDRAHRILAGGFADTSATPAAARLSESRLVHISSHFALTSQRDGLRFSADGKHLAAADSFSPDNLSDRRRRALADLELYLNDDDHPLLPKRPRAGAPSLGRTALTHFFFGDASVADRSVKAPARTSLSESMRKFKEARALYNQASVQQLQLSAQAFNFFNVPGEWDLARPYGEADLGLTSDGVISRVGNFTTANSVDQKRPASACVNRTPGSNTSCVRLGMKFEF